MIRASTIMRCDVKECNGPVKPKIVFFGEGLPKEFFETMKSIENFDERIEHEEAKVRLEAKKQEGGCDLLIVIGTALAVNPFNSIVDKPLDGVPKVLWNLENTTEHGYDFEDIKEFPNRLYMKGKCDDTIWKLCKDLGWVDDFVKSCPERLAKLNPYAKEAG